MWGQRHPASNREVRGTHQYIVCHNARERITKTQRHNGVTYITTKIRFIRGRAKLAPRFGVTKGAAAALTMSGPGQKPVSPQPTPKRTAPRIRFVSTSCQLLDTARAWGTLASHSAPRKMTKVTNRAEQLPSGKFQSLCVWGGVGVGGATLRWCAKRCAQNSQKDPECSVPPSETESAYHS